MSALRLDLGAGAASPPGFTPLGRPFGSEIFPLAFGDGTVDEIRVSHALEHFPTAQVAAVLADWVRALKPGGRLRIAVPDFAKVAASYLAGENQPTEGWIMGGQTDADDFHRAIFDEQRLKRALSEAGLVLLRPWTSEIDDSAALAISLNLEGTKPHQTDYRAAAVMSVPRLGFMDMMFCAQEAFPRLNISLRRSTGAFWGQCLTAAIEDAIRDEDPDFIVTVDYDSAFTAQDVATLLQLMLVYPEIDALAPIQASRHVETALFSKRDPDGKRLDIVPMADLAGDSMPVSTAHFGLTVLRAERLKTLPKPWFLAKPAPDGSWGEGHVDEDISFWRKWEAAGLSLHLAPRVAIGHLELMVRWPGPDLKAIYQPVSKWRASGKPEGAWR